MSDPSPDPAAEPERDSPAHHAAPHRPRSPRPPAPTSFQDRLLRLAAERRPPAGAGLLALAGWTLGLSQIMENRWRPHIVGAAGFFVVLAVMVNRLSYRYDKIRQQHLEDQQREWEHEIELEKAKHGHPVHHPAPKRETHHGEGDQKPG